VERALVTFVEKHPGLRVEEINRALGTETRELALPIRRLVATGILRMQGQKRGARYSVAAESRNN
jgi:predicted DNA-binding transcriptional regulator